MRDSFLGLGLAMLMLVSLMCSFELLTTRMPPVDAKQSVAEMYARHRSWRRRINALMIVGVLSMLGCVAGVIAVVVS